MCTHTLARQQVAVIANEDVGADHHLMVLAAPDAAATTSPGTFAMLGFSPPGNRILSRPLAILDADASGGTVTLLMKEVGAGTRQLGALRPGEHASLLAPLGNGWRIVESPDAVLVAGGTGYAAVHLLARELAVRGTHVRVIWGQACEDAFPDVSRVAPDSPELTLATDDGSCGFCGNSVECLSDIIQRELADRQPVIYGAGPIPMMRALAARAAEHDLPCQVSLEARMACGIGVCRGCVVNARTPHPHTGLHRRAVCVDGPAFDAIELDWENLM